MRTSLRIIRKKHQHCKRVKITQIEPKHILPIKMVESIGPNRKEKKSLGDLSYVRKGDIVHSCGGGGVNPSSSIKPKFTRFSNHSKRDFWHQDMNATASRLAWHGFPTSSLPPNTSLHPVLNHCLKTPSQIPWTSGQTLPYSSNNFPIFIFYFFIREHLLRQSIYFLWY